MKITFIAVALTQALAVAVSALPAAVNTTDTESAHALEARGPCSITLQWHSWWREGVWDRYRVKVTAAGKGPKQIGEPFQTEFNMLQEWCHIVQSLSTSPLAFVLIFSLPSADTFSLYDSSSRWCSQPSPPELPMLARKPEPHVGRRQHDDPPTMVPRKQKAQL